jgi:NitT/TauT family transport system ATP-binding protein
VDIQLKELTKSYDDKTVLDHLDITFSEGRINCLMGASGKGKTTVINLIMGLVKPDSGEVTGCKGRKITAVFQEDRLIEHWDALKNIRLVSDRTLTETRILKELSRVGIEEGRNKPVRSFSGGMRRRVALIRAMLAEGDILILDEPFKGLDEALKIKVIDYVKQNTKGKTVIIVTHEKVEAQLLEANVVTLV